MEPTLLMLDEPTNHLDLNAVIWLNKYDIDVKLKSDLFFYLLTYHLQSLVVGRNRIRMNTFKFKKYNEKLKISNGFINFF